MPILIFTAIKTLRIWHEPYINLEFEPEWILIFFSSLNCSSEVGLYKPWYDSKDSNETNERAKEAYEAVLTVTASYSSKSAEYRAFDNATRMLAKEKFGHDYESPVNNFVANFHDAVSFRCRLSNNVSLVVEFAIF